MIILVWMIFFSLSASMVNYGFMFKGFYAFIREFLIFANDIALSFFCVTLLDIFLYLILKRFSLLHKTAKIFLIAITFCMFSADIFSLYHYHIPLNMIMFEFVMMTNFRESSEFIQAYLSNFNFWIFALSILLLMYIIKNIFIKIFNHNKNLRVTVFVLLLILGTFAAWREVRFYNAFGRILNSTGITRLNNFFNLNNENRKNYERIVNGNSKEVLLTKNSSTIPYIVFILGESTTRNHMSLYGYSLINNPELSKFSSRNN